MMSAMMMSATLLTHVRAFPLRPWSWPGLGIETLHCLQFFATLSRRARCSTGGAYSAAAAATLQRQLHRSLQHVCTPHLLVARQQQQLGRATSRPGWHQPGTAGQQLTARFAVPNIHRTREFNSCNPAR